MDGLDLETFRLTKSNTLPQEGNRLRQRDRTWFVKGPIPGDWLEQAAAQPGKALHVALALWYLAGLQKSDQVTLTRKPLRLFSVLPDSGRRGLAALEKAGLVQVNRRNGRCPRVTILGKLPPGKDRAG